MVMRFDTGLSCVTRIPQRRICRLGSDGLIGSPVVLESEAASPGSTFRAPGGNREWKSHDRGIRDFRPQGQFFFETRPIPEFGAQRTVLVLTRNITNRK
jgi:hypothetical protein